MTRIQTFFLVATALGGSATFAQNDECAGAVPLVVGTPLAFDTTLATPSSPGWPCAMGGGPDLWYSLVATNAAAYTVSTCGSAFDTALEVFSGGCGALVSRGCSDDTCATQSSLTFAMNVGDVRWLRIGGHNGAVGAGTVLVTEAAISSPASNLVHYYLDDFGSVCYDAGSLGHDGVYVGTNQLSPGVTYGTRYSAFFNGSTDHVTIPAHPALDQLRNDFSVTAWIQSQWPGGVQRIVGNERFAGAPGSWSIGITLTSIRVSIHGIDELNVPVAWNLVGLAPNHIAVTMDGLNVVRVYRNATLVGTLQGRAPANAPNSTYVIGALAPNGTIAGEYFRGLIDDVQVYSGLLTPQQITQLYQNPGTNLGSANALCCGYCGNNPNSTGVSASILGHGSNVVGDNNYQLIVQNLPNNVFGYFLASRTMGFVPLAGGSQGNLCLGGAIGRYLGVSGYRNSGFLGSFSLRIELDRIPSPTGLVGAMPGDTWYFQAWYRDAVGGVATSNFSDGRRVTFL